MEDKSIIRKLAFAEGYYLGSWKSLPRKMINNFPLFGNEILSSKFGGSFAPSETILTRTSENIKMQIKELDKIMKEDLSTFEIWGNLRDSLVGVVGEIEEILFLMQEKADPTDDHGM